MDHVPAKNQISGPCTNCGTFVSKPASKVHGRMFCSSACYEETRQAECLVTKPCEGCGVPVTRKGKHDNPHTFCSKKCYGQSAYFLGRLAERNAKKYPDNRRRDPCSYCGTMVDVAKSTRRAERIFCNRECMKAHAIDHPVRQVTEGGYIRLFVGKGHPGSTGTGHILEHRKVMQDVLGRPLTKDENVHHVNGVRDDNRLENLELWSHSQPCGQRVEDKIRWAREFLELYEGSLPM